MSRLSFLCVLCVLCGANAFATTLYVDGVGTSPEHFSTISEALQALGASGLGTDGASDEIAVTVHAVFEPHGFAVNGGTEAAQGPSPEFITYGPVRDDLLIEGDGDDSGGSCFVQVFGDNDVFPGYHQRLTVHLASGQSVTFHAMTFLLPFVGPDLYSTEFLVVDEADPDEPLVDASFALERVGFDTVGVRLQDQLQGIAVVDIHDNPPGSSVTYRIEDSLIRRHRATGLQLRCDSASVEIARSAFYELGGAFHAGQTAIPYGYGLITLSRRSATVRLDHVFVADIGQDGFAFGHAAEAGETMRVDIGPGCEFSECGAYGTDGQTGNGIAQYGAPYSPTEGRSELHIHGTYEEPVVIDSNFRGIYSVANHGSDVDLQRVAITRSGSLGLTASGFDDPLHPLVARDCLFADNAALPYYYSACTNVRVTNGTVALVEHQFRRCTFHNVVTTDSQVLPPVEVSTNSRMGGDIVIALSDCLISGTADEDAFNLSGSASKTANLDHCVVALEGPDRVGWLNSTGQGTINMTGVLFVDPSYTDKTAPPTAGAFDVSNPALATAGSDGGPLSGWGHYVGPPAGPSHGILMH